MTSETFDRWWRDPATKQCIKTLFDEFSALREQLLKLQSNDAMFVASCFWQEKGKLELLQRLTTRDSLADLLVTEEEEKNERLH